jgi:hypothetical protein
LKKEVIHYGDSLMAILMLKDGERLYVSGTGLVDESARKQADKLDKELKERIALLEQSFIESGIISANGIKNDALQVWYRVGVALNDIGERFGVLGTSDEQYYWIAIYQYVSPLLQKGGVPSSANSLRNHFRACGYMATHEWEFVKGVGNWATWRDLLDNIKLQEDPRIFDWVVNTIHGSGAGHKDVRPFVHKVRQSIKNKDTRVLTDDELFMKLEPLLTLVPGKK